MNLFFSERIKNGLVIAYIIVEVYVVDNLKINILMKTNVIKSKDMIINFDKKIIIISICDNVEVPMMIWKRKTPVNCAIRTITHIVVSVEDIMVISIKLKSLALSKDRNFSFCLKKSNQFDLKGEFFTHVTDSNLITMQVWNTLTKSYTVSKNFKIGHLRNYDKKNAFWSLWKIVT